MYTHLPLIRGGSVFGIARNSELSVSQRDCLHIRVCNDTSIKALYGCYIPQNDADLA